MRKIHVVFGAFLSLFLLACEGPTGPPGFDGPQGPQGLDGMDAPLSKIIEIDATFTPENDYGIRYTFANTVEVLPTDVVLVYNFWGEVDGDDGLPIAIWRPLPQTLLVEQGILQYNFEHTFVDVDIFLETDFDKALLLAGDTNNLLFRIAVIPAESAGKANLDHSNINEVMKSLGVTESDIQRIIR